MARSLGRMRALVESQKRLHLSPEEAMPAAQIEHRSPPPSEIDYPRIGLIAVGHLTNDIYGSIISSLMPYLVLAGKISTATAGFVLLAYLIGSSVLQPIFGLVSDTTGKRQFVTFGPLLVGLSAVAVSWASGTVTILLFAGLGGVGTAAFHPQAASMISGLSRNAKGWSMSLFATGGNVGYSFGPLLAALIATAGLHWSVALIPPGLAVTYLLSRHAPEIVRSEERLDVGELKAALRTAWRPLSLIVGIIAARSSVQFAMILFLPLYYYQHGLTAQLGSSLAFVFSFAGAIGGLIGGRLSDIYGRKLVLMLTLLLSCPVLLLALSSRGILAWPLFALSGALLIASNSITVVQGQEWLPGNTGIASGLTLGVGFGLSGVFITIYSNLAQHIGVTEVIFLSPLVALATVGLGALLRSPPVLTTAAGMPAH
jgi:MFS transporter, FSR family, fosmidomycin resistance protein